MNIGKETVHTIVREDLFPFLKITQADSRTKRKQIRCADDGLVFAKNLKK